MSRKVPIDPTGLILFFRCPIKRVDTEFHIYCSDIKEGKEYVEVECFECNKKHHVRLP